MLRAIWIVCSFLVLACLGTTQAPNDAQSGSAPKEDKITFVSRIDIAHAVAINGQPHAEKSDDGTIHYVCEIDVLHDDKTVFKEYPYIAIVHSDAEVLTAIKKSYEVCGERVVEIVSEYQSYQRALAQTINAKKGGKL